MAFFDSNLSVRSDLAEEMLVPERVDGWPDVVHISGFPYRIEAWLLTDGGHAVVVRRLVHAPTFVNTWKPIVDFVDERWGTDALIIEDWGYKGLHGHRFHIMSRDEGHSVADPDELRARGLVLSTDPFQEP